LTLKLVRNAARVVENLPVNFSDTTTNRCGFMGYWAWARVSSQGETSSLSINQVAANFAAYSAGI